MIIRPSVNIRPFVLVEHAGFRYLAVIQNGTQIGALAQTPEGRYVQVNGAVVQPLNTFKVLRALRQEFPRKNWSRNPSPPVAAPAVGVQPQSLDSERQIERPVTVPVVSVRRRRRVPAEALQG
ncbi:hypothetical protein FQZ97_1008860 [compost metagenome]